MEAALAAQKQSTAAAHAAKRQALGRSLDAAKKVEKLHGEQNATLKKLKEKNKEWRKNEKSNVWDAALAQDAGQKEVLARTASGKDLHLELGAEIRSTLVLTVAPPGPSAGRARGKFSGARSPETKGRSNAAESAW